MDRNDNLLLNWQEAYAAGPAIVGGKAWNLGRLVRYGFAVPPGVALIAAAYEAFIEQNNLREMIKQVADQVSLESLACGAANSDLQQLRERIVSGTMPPVLQEAIATALAAAGLLEQPLAIRSSATCEDSTEASFAGIHDSFLNLRGLPDLLTAIQKCYASIWTERAVAYRRKLGISDLEVAPAVVLMQMVPAASAGVAFSCDPRSGQEERMVISANFGLGESVVSGTVDPDEYLVLVDQLAPVARLTTKVRLGRKEYSTVSATTGGTVRDSHTVRDKEQVLSGQEILRLAVLVQLVFCALGNAETHQDIEWVHDGEQFWLVQARPVTALPNYTYPQLRNQPLFWSNANLRDALPMVQTPLNWSISKPLIDQILYAQYGAAGYQLDRATTRTRLFNGRAYFNLAQLQWECYDAYGLLPERYNDFIGGHQPEIRLPKQEPFSLRSARMIRNLRVMRQIYRVKKEAPATFQHLTGRIDQLRQRQLGERSDNQLLELIQEAEQLFRQAEPLMVMLSASGAVFMLLPPLLERYIPGKGRALTMALLAGQEGITSAEHGTRLAELAALLEQDAAARDYFVADPFIPKDWEQLPGNSPFRSAFQRFLDDYGHRCVYELDYRNPRWSEDPTYLLQTIRTMRTTTFEESQKRQQNRQAEAWQTIHARVPRLLHGMIRYLATQGGIDAANREMSKSILVRLGDVDRRVMLEIAQRLVKRGILAEQDDLFLLFWPELRELMAGQWDGAGIRERIEDRKVRHAAFEALAAPDLIQEEQHDAAEPLPEPDGNELTGLTVSSGHARGPARLIRHPDEGTRLSSGDLLVAPSTDPAWTPLFLKAAGLVTETGGFISHGAIVAREYGIPAVVNVRGAMTRLEEGPEVMVDGDNGRVWQTEADNGR